MPILKDPTPVKETDYLITESTYGDRLHSPIEQMDDDLAADEARKESGLPEGKEPPAKAIEKAAARRNMPA